MGSLFPRVLKTLYSTFKNKSAHVFNIQTRLSLPFCFFFPFQRNCCQEKAGCYGSFTVDHFSTRRLENIQPFQVTWFTKHSQVHCDKNEEEETDKIVSEKQCSVLPISGLHILVTRTSITMAHLDKLFFQRHAYKWWHFRKTADSFVSKIIHSSCHCCVLSIKLMFCNSIRSGS